MPRTSPTAVAALGLALLAAGLAGTARGATALELLRKAPKPRFREGHTLPPLTRWGWTLSFDVQVELTEHWGYALELGEANAGLVQQLADPKSVASRLCALTASDPKRYPLSLLTYRACLNKDFIASLPASAFCRGADGKPIEGTRWQLWSPEAPDQVFEQAAALGVEPLKKVLERAPVAVILNGGEYALSVYGHSGKSWQQDPMVLKAKGDRDWFDYISERKGHQETIISDAFRKACPNRDLYIFYYADGSPHRNRYGGWWTWAWDYKPMMPVSDLPSSSSYYNDFNSGWTGDSDLLVQTLNSIAQQIALSQPLSYNWVCGGWTREKLGERAFSDPEHYMGYLKAYYTAGMIGGIAGYFAYPKGGFAGEVEPVPLNWLRQITLLARVHALFSGLEDFLRKGDLLPGPLKHKWSKDLPAYEFPVGESDARILARKSRDRDEWLVTAWAAGGPDRQVSVEIPGLGTVRLEARACGSVYRARLEGGKPALTRVDENGMFPTAAHGLPITP